jgi:hypothetical protein
MDDILNEFKSIELCRNAKTILQEEIARLEKQNEALEKIIRALKPAEMVEDIERCFKQSHNNLELINKEQFVIKNAVLGDGKPFQNKGIYHLALKARNNSIKKIKSKQISQICISELRFYLNQFHSKQVMSLLILSDTRFVTGSKDGSIIISKKGWTKQYKIDIKRENAHNGAVTSLLELPSPLTNKKEKVSLFIISTSEDHYINAWEIKEKKLDNLISIQRHNDIVHKVIKLSNYRYASCSSDTYIKIWTNFSIEDIINTIAPKANKKTIQEEASIKNEGKVYSILQLSNKELLAASCETSPNKGRIVFWNLMSYTQLKTYKGMNTTIENVYAKIPSHMIELYNGNIAVSNNNQIVIINTKQFEISQCITDELIIHSSSLFVWDSQSFVYIYKGKCVQISSKNNKIISKIKLDKIDKDIDGYYDVVLHENGKYILITQENTNGAIVIKLSE